MKPTGNNLGARSLMRCSAGIALLDVLLAIAVFAFGILALAQLQGSLARSSADANARTVAANIAEELVETLRGYRSIQADPDPDVFGFVEMNNFTDTTERAGITYAREVTVENFWWDDDNDTFIKTTTPEAPDALGSLAYPNFKLLRVDVSWGNSDDFYVSDGVTTGLGTGSVTIYEVVPSSPPVFGAQLAASLDGSKKPTVLYNPGENPKIIALQLDEIGERFKESTSVQPLKLKYGSETWFDVVTYSQVDVEGEGKVSEFLRREEFVVVDCLCEMGGSGKGFTPALWNGVSYTLGDFVEKPIGIDPYAAGGSDSNVDSSQYCSTCCRDHHDTSNSASDEIYSAAKGGGHPHWFVEDADKDGVSEFYPPEQRNNQYHEVCRLVRKDGFMTMTKDVDQGTLVAFPQGFLDEEQGVEEYSEYALTAVGTHFGTNNGSGTFPQPAEDAFVARVEDDARDPFGDFSVESQLRARAIYADYLTQDAKDVVANCFPDPNDDCVAPQASSALEIYPFFDLQMTWLANWFIEGGSSVAKIEPGAFVEAAWDDFNPTDDPAYDRGVLELINFTSPDKITVAASSEKGNAGITANGAYDKVYTASDDDLWFTLNGYDGTSTPVIGEIVSGTISFDADFDENKLGIVSENASCGTRALPDGTGNEWSCIVPSGTGYMTFENLEQKIRGKLTLFNACTQLTSVAANGSVTFTLNGEGENNSISLTKDNCP